MSEWGVYGIRGIGVSKIDRLSKTVPIPTSLERSETEPSSIGSGLGFAFQAIWFRDESVRDENQKATNKTEKTDRNRLVLKPNQAHSGRD